MPENDESRPPKETGPARSTIASTTLPEPYDCFGELEDALRRAEAHNPPFSREPYVAALRLARSENPQARRAVADIYRERSWWSYWRREAA